MPSPSAIRTWWDARARQGIRGLPPARGGWVRLFAAASSYLLLLALLATVICKGLALAELEGGGMTMLPELARASTIDFAVHGALIAACAAFEARFRWAHLATAPVALVACVLAIASGIYLVVSGEQATWEAVVMLEKRWSDVSSIAEEMLESRLVATAGLGILIASSVPPVVRWMLARYDEPWDRVRHGAWRAWCGLYVAVAASAMWLVVPPAASLALRHLGKNPLTLVARTLVYQLDDGDFAGYASPELASDDEIARLGARTDAPNVVVLVLESTRYDHTSLDPSQGGDPTPNLRGLAERGLVAHRTRAVLPHTTKSVFSLLCGRYPTLQKKLVELSEDLEVQCLPRLLTRAGYYTGFFQSSWGTFEERARLVQLLGFEHFEAWEDIRGERLGYLASDDESLAKPLADWLHDIDAANNRFFATLLTSATHHPYRTTKKINDRLRELGLAAGATHEEHYARLVEAEDVLIGDVERVLEEAGLAEKTIVVVLGDHGEGFGLHGVKQHDNNFYEEGLRVPLVMAGPGVPRIDVAGNASLIDVTPTLMSILGIAANPEIAYGIDLTGGAVSEDEPRYFSCWFELRCRGFVLGDRKVVYEPQTDEAWYFDLAADPGELLPLPLPRELARHLPPLGRLVEAHLARDWTIVHGEVGRYGQWRCDAGSPLCKHPAAKKAKHRYRTAESKKAKAGKGKAKGKGKPKGKPKKPEPAPVELEAQEQAPPPPPTPGDPPTRPPPARKQAPPKPADQRK